jgi:hypothetical protein
MINAEPITPSDLFLISGISSIINAIPQSTTGANVERKRKDFMEVSNPKGYKTNAVPGGLPGNSFKMRFHS